MADGTADTLPDPNRSHVADTEPSIEPIAANSTILSNRRQSFPVELQGGNYETTQFTEDSSDRKRASRMEPNTSHTEPPKTNARNQYNLVEGFADSPRVPTGGMEPRPRALYVSFVHSKQQAIGLFTAKSQAKIKKLKQIPSKFSPTNFRIEFESHEVAKEVLEEVQSDLRKRTGRKPKVQFFHEKSTTYPKKTLFRQDTLPEQQPQSLVTDSEAVENVLPTNDESGNKATGNYCSLQLVARLPYTYMIDVSNRLSKHFFAANKFYEREWDIYCLYPPVTSGHAPLFLLPLHQVQQLVDDIGKAFNTTFLLPKDPFTITFYDDGTPQPRFLGTTRSRAAVTQLQDNVPAVDVDHGETPRGASPAQERYFAAFKAKCDRIRNANKGDRSLKATKKAEDRLVAFREGVSGLRRVQRYLGLQAMTEDPIAPDPSLPLEEQRSFEAEQYKSCGIQLEPIDLDRPVPHKFDKEPVIICFDIEAYERAHHIITEIGVSTLDTLDIVDLAPGEGGNNWMGQIRSRHFRIKGRTHFRNNRFVGGDPDAFHFSKSEFVSLAEAPHVVDSCFRYPFSAGFKQNERSSTGKPLPASTQNSPEQRRLVLVGHQIQSDIQFLKVLGSKIFLAAPGSDLSIGSSDVFKDVEEALNVDILYKVLKRENQTRSLGNVLSDLGREAWGLHNGGNDARYTLEALIGLAVKARLEEDDKAKLWIVKGDEDISGVGKAEIPSLPAAPDESLFKESTSTWKPSTMLDTHDQEGTTVSLPSRSVLTTDENKSFESKSLVDLSRDILCGIRGENADHGDEVGVEQVGYENEIEDEDEDEDSDDFEM